MKSQVDGHTKSAAHDLSTQSRTVQVSLNPSTSIGFVVERVQARLSRRVCTCLSNNGRPTRGGQRIILKLEETILAAMGKDSRHREFMTLDTPGLGSKFLLGGDQSTSFEEAYLI